MPTYTYMCDDCGLAKDVLIKMDDRDNPGTCTCGGKLLRIFNFTGGVFIR